VGDCTIGLPGGEFLAEFRKAQMQVRRAKKGLPCVAIGAKQGRLISPQAAK